MFIVRPATDTDLPALEALAGLAPPAVHTLPRTRAGLEDALQCSIASFDAQPEQPGAESYLFVLETVEENTLAGVAMLSATAGGKGTYFSFRKDALNQVSRDLDISHHVDALTLCTDLTHCSQLSGFYVREQHRSRQEAALLSRARLLFAASAPHRFSPHFFSAMPGVTDPEGQSPFWDAIGRKFFGMDFLAAERMVEGARNRTVIVELMPHYPVYVPLLPTAARAAMGQVHPDGALAGRLLSAEGFAFDKYIDIFDGGAVLQAHRLAMASFARSRRRNAVVKAVDAPRGSAYLVAATEEGEFRATLANCSLPPGTDTVALPEAVMRVLNRAPGDSVLCVKL
jgi:arginine N-succinyltransferase